MQAPSLKTLHRARTVGGLSSTDVDSGDTFTYTLVSGTGDTDNASFNVSGANLVTAAVFNFEVKNSYSVRVQHCRCRWPEL